MDEKLTWLNLPLWLHTLIEALKAFTVDNQSDNRLTNPKIMHRNNIAQAGKIIWAVTAPQINFLE